MRKQIFSTGCLWAILLALPLGAQKFYTDDPLEKEIPPYPVEDANVRELSLLLDLFSSFGQKGEGHPAQAVIPAMGVNTLGEVPDGPWYVNRHARKRMTTEELMRGPGNQKPPNPDNTWEVLTVQRYGDQPGILFADGGGDLYLLRMDPGRNLEMMTGAQMVSSKIFWALGYWTAEDYIVYFDRGQLRASKAGGRITSVGTERQLLEEDIDLFLKNVAQTPLKNYRAVAHRVPRGTKILGPYTLHGTRSDDPNDIVAHEHRRDLRGLRVFAAWVNHYSMSPLATADVLIQDQEPHHIRHLLFDFIGTLGSGYLQSKVAREGNEMLFEPGKALRHLFGFGAYSPRWQRAKYPKYRSVGKFTYEVFDPEKWTTSYKLPPFENMLPDDAFWAAKQVMAFTDEDLRAIIKTGQFSSSDAEAWLAKCLIERRTKIGRTYFDKVLPLDHFRVEGGELKFEDLGVRYGFNPAHSYTVRWSQYDNFRNEHVGIGLPLKDDFELPPVMASAADGSYFAAELSVDDSGKTVTVYVRKEEGGPRVVGIDRGWPGKVIAQPERKKRTRKSRYPDLSKRQKELFDPHANDYAEKAGREISPREYFDEVSISAQTTFEAVTHALKSSELTDENGKSLGDALELVDSVERIAGMEYGRGGDEQFRMYFKLKPHARERLEKSQEFIRDKDNTVYHVGYPLSYRQGKKPPSTQFSMTEDGSRADVDVDYRSSKIPQALWNGHLRSANSDVRAGKNHQVHTRKWSGLINWWTSLFGKQPDQETERDDLFAEPPEPPIPLPSNRPLGAAIPQLHDAMEEFLADWLVRRNIDEAMEFVSPNALACVNIDEDAENEILSAAQAQAELRLEMRQTAKALGHPHNLTEVIDEFRPWREALRVVSHPFEKDFTIIEVPDTFAKAFRCESRSEEEQKRALTGTNLQYGTYYETIFRFKVEGNRGGVLGILWTKENGAWRIVSWEAYEQ